MGIVANPLGFWRHEFQRNIPRDPRRVNRTKVALQESIWGGKSCGFLWLPVRMVASAAVLAKNMKETMTEAKLHGFKMYIKTENKYDRTRGEEKLGNEPYGQ